MSTTNPDRHPDLQRGDVVLVAFPFVAGPDVQRKRRPALVVQANRYNRRRSAVVVAAITTSQTHASLPAKVAVPQDSDAGRAAGLRLDSVIDCQTLATLPRREIVSRLGRLPADLMRQVDRALADALDLPGGESTAGTSGEDT